MLCIHMEEIKVYIRRVTWAGFHANSIHISDNFIRNVNSMISFIQLTYESTYTSVVFIGTVRRFIQHWV